MLEAVIDLERLIDRRLLFRILFPEIIQAAAEGFGKLCSSGDLRLLKTLGILDRPFGYSRGVGKSLLSKAFLYADLFKLKHTFTFSFP